MAGERVGYSSYSDAEKEAYNNLPHVKDMNEARELAKKEQIKEDLPYWIVSGLVLILGGVLIWRKR